MGFALITEGLCFACQKCLYCCSSEPGYVYLSKSDIENASSYVGLDFRSFLSVYCRRLDMGMYYMYSLKEKSNYDCIFLTGNGCSIYPARPVQCRTYPFWKEILESRESWENEKKSCPGIGKGALVSPSEVRRNLEANNANAPYIEFKK
ncbi:MAG: YkgJ family cysteine cluster protein [Candidatus Ornithospirochaeta sp.]|nr:YkgJ family cysteine cluster protein [Candidatus Ornithospirochaeta sp.]